LKLFSPLILLDAMNAKREIARIEANEHRCQVQRVTRAIPTTRNVLASISGRSGKNGKPICYNVSAIQGPHSMSNRKQIIELMKRRYNLPAGKDRFSAYRRLTAKIDALQREDDRAEVKAK